MYLLRYFFVPRPIVSSGRGSPRHCHCWSTLRQTKSNFSRGEGKILLDIISFIACLKNTRQIENGFLSFPCSNCFSSSSLFCPLIYILGFKLSFSSVVHSIWAIHNRIWRAYFRYMVVWAKVLQNFLSFLQKTTEPDLLSFFLFHNPFS